MAQSKQSPKKIPHSRKKKLKNKIPLTPITFTYFIPAPPSRQLGYRENHFDQLFKSFLEIGFEIIDFKVAPISGNGYNQSSNLPSQNAQGVWVFYVLRPLNAEAQNTVWEDFQNNFQSRMAKIPRSDDPNFEIEMDMDIGLDQNVHRDIQADETIDYE